MQLTISTFAELLNHAATKYGQRDAFQIRKGAGFRSVSFETHREHVFNVAAWLTKDVLSQ